MRELPITFARRGLGESYPRTRPEAKSVTRRVEGWQLGYTVPETERKWKVRFVVRTDRSPFMRIVFTPAENPRPNHLETL